ncbi:CRISPR-associated endoribonuclease Cas6 [Marinitoga hydrogenitolerans DSM 16785]|uniref:CRISPR-associated endoribonuclease Cas6 n=1 Tax=Marinitoga hydrogenitolerans (strain DSM 16785 / JCM 12826 / AT1271) TaxID=1122195 RepID=A0A1M5A776_MARH1|nr:CRISPR-associated endoribonuclease Cas6 [Marinitoga hydrogenitolerans]SHF25682.1 CRISPR-associated endoribonuclease Cas6 [Marinitoga hydrogenitolerans DSM 16785]
MFYSVVVELKPLETSIIPEYPGKKIHGLFYSLINASNKKLSKLLHETKIKKAFTVSTFLGKRVDKPIIIEKNKKYYIRITILDESLFNFFALALYQKKMKKEKVKIGEIEFEILRILYDKKHSKWADIFIEDEIFNRQVEESKVKLRFYTPTLFKVGDKHLRYPDPEKIFSGLLEKFNLYGTHKINSEIKNKFNKISITYKKIYQKKVYIRNFYLEGFIGETEFKVPEEEKELMKIVNILSEFAFYAGIGYKTTMGMGQAKRIDNN